MTPATGALVPAPPGVTVRYEDIYVPLPLTTAPSTTPVTGTGEFGHDEKDTNGHAGQESEDEPGEEEDD
jgi:hypothetical protein